MTTPLPQDLQDLFDAVVSAVTDAKAADATKSATGQALVGAQTADAAAAADQLAKHQASTATVESFVAGFQKDYPTA